ncbi:hypothetical protein [Modestobacter italicus]|uniref:hypothetical protein n=1 Tax=Modestobacter italicus (strain DSM 44449 / CECT 9708 / BC 501) TaxID=2732864 RepID=UPI001C98A58A|nr:hypothetical protein [Modestobacter italicus]
MRLPITPSEIAPRIATGAFILNSGLGKRGADAETAAGLHGFAAGTYPVLKKVPATTFAKGLSTAEITIGALLLTPLVPGAVAGVALTGFSAGLLGLYLRTPGMTKPGKSVAPTQDGLPIAKDVWMLGIGLGLITQGLVGREARIGTRKPSRASRKATRKAAADAAKLSAASKALTRAREAVAA